MGPLFSGLVVVALAGGVFGLLFCVLCFFVRARRAAIIALVATGGISVGVVFAGLVGLVVAPYGTLASRVQVLTYLLSLATAGLAGGAVAVRLYINMAGKAHEEMRGKEMCSNLPIDADPQQQAAAPSQVVVIRSSQR